MNGAALRLAVATLLSLALLSGARAQMVARVNGAPITSEQLDRAYATVLRERKLHVSRMQNPAQARELKRVALDRLIAEELFWQQARKEGRVASDDEVDKAFEQSVAGFASREAFELQLLRQGLDTKAFRAEIRRLMSADRYAQQVVEQRVRINEADIEAFYAANPHLYRKPELLHVRTITVAASGATLEARGAARTRVDALRKQLVQGADFDVLARQHSDDPTRQWGGALDPAPLADLPTWMRAQVAKLAPGALSPAIETAEGYHLVRLDRREPAQSIDLAAARSGIADHLQSTRGRAALEQAASELRAAARIEMLVPF